MASKVLLRFQTAFGPNKSEPTDGAGTPPIDTIQDQEKKHATVDGVADVNGSGDLEPERPSQDIQRGVQNVEAVTLAWSRKALIAVFVK